MRIRSSVAQVWRVAWNGMSGSLAFLIRRLNERSTTLEASNEVPLGVANTSPRSSNPIRRYNGRHTPGIGLFTG